jgi:hypothetical protein
MIRCGTGRSRSWKGDSVERVVHFTFGIHAPADTVSSWLTAIGACGIVRPVEGSERSYLVTVRRAGAMEYLETLLAEGRRRGVLTWRPPVP